MAPRRRRAPQLHRRLWFGRHLDPAILAEFVEESRQDHDRADDPHRQAVLRFGIAYERAVLGWLDELRATTAVGRTTG